LSGPVERVDVDGDAPSPEADAGAVEITASRESEVGGFRVRRALPRRGRRTIGAWCFLDHMGPADVSSESGMDVAPHPHLGLQTVTWLLAGEVVHRDSLGSEQVIRPGELNLMTAGRGVSHSEENTHRYDGSLQGVQLWVALPAETRDDGPGFEHHRELPIVSLGADSEATVLLGSFTDETSPARRDTDHLGAELRLRGATTIPLVPAAEHGLVVLEGTVFLAEGPLEPGHLAYLAPGRDELELRAEGPVRVMLLGGTPFAEPIAMWWNFVARTQDELTAAYEDWAEGNDRFGHVASSLPRTEVSPPPWRSTA
jgi:redox-sensitive bicupin YhaK (pirin superfamily)